MQLGLLNIILLASTLRVATSNANGPSVDEVTNYFRPFGISTISLLLCSSHYSQLRTGKALAKAGFQVSYGVPPPISGLSRSGALLDTTCWNNYSTISGWFRNGLVEWLAFGDPGVYLPALPDSSLTFRTSDGSLRDLYIPGLGQPAVSSRYQPGQLRRHGDFRRVTLSAAHLNLDENSGREVRIRDGGDFGGLECLDSPAGGWNPNMSLPLVQNLADQLNFNLKLVPSRRPSGCRGVRQLLANGSVTFSATALMMTSSLLDLTQVSTQLFSVKQEFPNRESIPLDGPYRPPRVSIKLSEESRLSVGDLQPEEDSRSRILYKQPGLSTVTNIYLLPFEGGVWLSCLCAVLVVTGLLVLALRAGGAFDEPGVGAAEMCTLVIGFVCQQGTHLNPRSLTVRIIIVVFSMSSLFLYTSYSANIVALLQSSKPTVKTLDELGGSPLRLLLQDTPYNQAYFQEVSDPEVKNLVSKKKIGENSYTSVNDGVAEVRKGTTAFNVECSAAYRRISEIFEEHEKCGLSELKVFTIPPLGVPLVAKSGYRDQFARKLSWQLETGLVSRWEGAALSPKPECTAADGGFVSVGLQDFRPALLVLLWGQAASLVAFLLELVTASVVKKKSIQFRDLDFQN